MCVAVLSYKRTAELWGRTSKTGIQKITRKPCASFLLLSFRDVFLLHTPWSLFFSVGSFSYSPMLLYMGSFSWSYTPCAGLCGKHLLHAPVLVYMGSFSDMPSAGFIWGVSLICPVLVYMWSFPTHLSLGSFSPKIYAGFFISLCREFLLYKTKRKNVNVNKNVHNWVMLLFKAEADIQTSSTGSTRLQQTMLK